jgi:uncharacterized protein
MSSEDLFHSLRTFVDGRYPDARRSKVHGEKHWRTVLANAVLIASDMGYDLSKEERAMLIIFSELHDCARRNDDRDPLHGFRAATAMTVFFQSFPEHDMRAMNRFALREAIAWHSEGRISHPHPVVEVCWDADRLDLTRVGIIPNPERLCTPAARALANNFLRQK